MKTEKEIEKLAEEYAEECNDCYTNDLNGFMAGYKAALQNKSDEDNDNYFLQRLISELPQYGIDTSEWEHNYGDCCYGGAVEFLSRCIKGYAKIIKNENTLCSRVYVQ